MTDPLCCPRCWSTYIIGIKVQGVYDGILIWECGECDNRWPRFSKDDSPLLHRLGREHMHQYDDHR